MSSAAEGATVSTDGEWWWDGVQWLPISSLDGRWRFDGDARRRTNAWRSPPLGVLIASAIWAGAIALWAPIAVVLSGDPDGGVAPDAIDSFGALALCIVIATVMHGLVLGLKTQLRWIWVVALLGTCMQMVGYVAIMVGTPQPGGVEDDAAAVGIEILSMPILIAVAGLLWIGAGTGRLVHWSRHGRKGPRLPRDDAALEQRVTAT